MRVLQVHNPYRYAGGEDTVVASEARLLRDGGHPVIRHIVPNPDDALTAARRLAVSAHNPRAAADLREAIVRHRPDVVHLHNWWFSLTPSVVRAASDAGVPTVVTLHNYRLLCLNGLLLRDGRPCEDCVGRVPAPGVRYACYRGSRPQSAVLATALQANRAVRTWDLVDRFLVLSRFARSRFVAGGLAEERMTVVDHHVDDAGPRPSPPSTSRTVLFVGRLSAEKGVDVLLEAWRGASPVDLRLEIIGAGPEGDRLARELPPGATMTGALPPDEVRRRLREARALVFPTRAYEGQPLVVLEAFEAGLPVLGSGHGATGELLADIPGGWTAAADDADAWAGAIGRLSDGARVDAAGEHVRRRYEHRFTAPAALSRLEAVYAQVIAGSR